MSIRSHTTEFQKMEKKRQAMPGKQSKQSGAMPGREGLQRRAAGG